MKNKSKLMVAVAIVLALVVGFLSGYFIEYPKVDHSEFAGTIGKVSNYRNTKATEADIELRNDLMTDQKRQKAVSMYMTYYYAKSLEFGKTIDFAVEQAKSDNAFAAQYPTQIAAVEKYAQFLETSRKDLLLTTIICQSVEDATPEMLRNAIAQSNNIIAQMNHRNNSVITFIDSLEEYILKTGTAVNENLNQVHDLLVLNQKGASAMTKDKVLMQYFDNKQLFAKDVKLVPADVKANVMRDMENLNEFYPRDMESLDMTQLIKDQEKLGLINDTEVLGGGFCLLCLMNDVEQLGVVFLDAEQLGTGFTDAEQLGTGFTDAEQLGFIIY